MNDLKTNVNQIDTESRKPINSLLLTLLMILFTSRCDGCSNAETSPEIEQSYMRKLSNMNKFFSNIKILPPLSEAKST